MQARLALEPSMTKLGQCPKIASTIIQNVTTSRDLISLALVSRPFLPLALKKLWSKPKFSNYLKLQQFLSTLSSPSQSLAYRTFVQDLHVDNFPEIGDDAFKLLEGCENLMYLEIPRCQRLTNSTLHSALGHYRSLLVVDFEDLLSITDETIIDLARNNPGLQGAKLSGCSLLTDRSLLFLGNYCSNLREVFLNNIPLITAFGLRYLLVSCPRIQALDVSQCKFVDDEILRLIWATLPTLRKLFVAGCSKITDQGFTSTGTVFIGRQPTSAIDPELRVATDNARLSAVTTATSTGSHPAIPNPAAFNLKQLDLTDCEKLTDVAVRIITANSPKLHALVLRNCFLLTNNAIQAITRLENHINTLGLGKLSSVTDEAIEGLAKHCRRLKGVDVSDCTKLTNRSVYALSTLSKLESARFNSIENVTDDGIRALADRHRPTLKRLHLSYCKLITTTAIDYLLSKQPQVEFISLSGIPSFLDDPALQVISKPPGKGFSRKTYRVYPSQKLTNQLHQVLSQRPRDSENELDHSAADSLDPLNPPQQGRDQIAGSATTSAVIAIPASLPAAESPAHHESPPPPPLQVQPTQVELHSSSNGINKSHDGTRSLDLRPAQGTSATPEPEPTNVLSEEASSSDPDHLSGSISSFEDLEDTAYDILQDSDLESDESYEGSGNDNDDVSGCGTGGERGQEKREAQFETIRGDQSRNQGRSAKLKALEVGVDDDDEGFEFLSDFGGVESDVDDTRYYEAM